MTPITEAGLLKLKDKLESLRQDRAYWVDKKEDAKSQGSSEDNSEYQLAVEEMEKIENNISKVEVMILNSKVIDYSSLDVESVKFGLTVILENDETKEKFTYQIVGTNEADPSIGKISNISPLGSILLGKQVDDEVSSRDDTFVILEIKNI